MIGFVRGKLVVKTPPHLTVDVGGVGYDIEAPMSTFYTLPAIGSDRRWIELEEPIKSLGVFAVPVRLHTDVKPEIKVWVIKAD